MFMPKKRAILGLRGIALAKVAENTVLAYRSGVAKALPFAGSINRTPKEKKQDIYYDDGLYTQLNELLGEEFEIRLAEIALEHLAELGLGTFDADTQTFQGDFTPRPGTYSLRCVGDTADKAPYYFNWRVFELTGIRFDNFTTRGDNMKVSEVIIIGVAKRPMLTSVSPWAIRRLDEEGANQTDCDAFLREGEQFPNT
jgi:hypothetical protein